MLTRIFTIFTIKLREHGRRIPYHFWVRFPKVLPVFTARRVCIAWTMPSQDVCLSVCLPIYLSVCHTPVYCRHHWTYPQFLPWGSPTILVFFRTCTKRDDNTSTGTLPNGAVECKGLTTFNQYLALSWKWCKIQP